MNTRSSILFLAAFLAISPSFLNAQEKAPAVEGAEPVEIQGEEPKPVEVPVPPLREKIEEAKAKGIPEVPKPIKNFGQLGGADKTRLDQLEMDYASGRITQAQYEEERDSLFREANVTF